MVGSQFTSTLSESGIDIQDFIKGDFKAVDYDDDFVWQVTSPEVMFFRYVPEDNMWKYICYWYQTDSHGEGLDNDDGWVTDQAEYAEFNIKPGDGFWFLDMNPADSEGCTIQLAGKVKSGDTDVSISGTGYNMVCNPFPTALNINSPTFTMTGVTAVDYDDDFEWQSTSPMISTWRHVDDMWKYVSYWYQTDSHGEGLDNDDGWVTDQAEYADIDLQPSEGFWFLNPTGDATLHFKTPIAK